jgi:hypothetical protein
MRAACLLAAIGTQDLETDAELARAHAGALLIAEAMHELTLIRKLLTPKGNDRS